MSSKKSSINARRWLAVHRVAGLIVAINLLLVSFTGIVLIFHDDIGAMLGTAPEGVSGRPSLPLGTLIDRAREAHPGQNAIWAFQDAEELPGLLYVGTRAGERLFDEKVTLTVLNRETGAIVEVPEFDDTFVGVVYHLHVDLMAGPIGQFLVGLVGIAFLVTLITGFVVYGPMMRRFEFGTLRSEKQRRTYFADVHKLFGAATFGWNLVVAFTGTLLELSGPFFQLYAATDIAEFSKPYSHETIVDDTSTAQAAVEAALEGHPGMDWSLLALPGSPFASPVHYAVLYEGGEGIESKMQSFSLVDARDPTKVHPRELPGYLKALMLSEPLHFGDYGGLPLQIVWTIFATITMVMSATGIYVFFASRKNKGGARDEALDAEPDTTADPATTEVTP